MPPVATLEAVLTLQKQAYDKGLQDAQRQTQQAAQSIARQYTPVSDAWGKIGGVLASAARLIGQAWSKITGMLGSAARALGEAFVAAGTAVTAYAVANSQNYVKTTQFNSALMQTAKQAGISSDVINTQIKRMKDLGASTDTAQQTVMSLVRAGLDASNAWQLYARAEDIAVTTGQTGQDVIERLVYGIERQNTEVLKTAGVNIDAVKAQDEYAASLGKTRGDLTQTERQQATYNAVMQASANVAGVAQEMMDKGVFNWLALKAPMQDVGNIAGSLVEPALTQVGRAVYDLARNFASAADEGGVLRPVIDAIRQVAEQLGKPVGDLIKWFSDWIKGLDRNQVKGFADTLKDLLPAVVPLVTALTGFLAPDLIGRIPVLGQLFKGLNGPVLGVVGALGGLLLSSDEVRGAFGAVIQAMQPLLPILGEALRSAVEAITPVIADLVTALAPIVPVLAKVAAELISKLVPVAVKLFEALAPIIPVLAMFAAQLISRLVPIIVKLFEALAPIIPVLAQFAAELITELVPIALKLFEAFAPLLPVLAQLAAQLISKLVPVALKLFEAFAPLLPILADMAVQLLGGLLPAILPIVEAIATGLEPLFEALGPILKELFKAFEPLIPPLVQLAQVFAQALVPIIQALLPLLVPLVQVIGTLLVLAVQQATPLIKFLAGALSAVIPILSAIVSGVINFVTMVVGWFQWLFDKLVGHSILSDLRDAIAGIWAFIYDNTIGRVKAMWQWVQDRFAQAKDWVTTKIGELRDAAASIWQQVYDNTLGRVQQMWQWVQDRFSQAKDWITTKVGELRDALVGIWQKVYDNTVGKVLAMWDWVTTKFQNAKDLVVSTAQTMSSKVIGVFDGMKSAVNNAMKGMANWVIDRLNDALHVIKWFLQKVSDSPLGKLGVTFDTTKMKDIEHFAGGGVVRGSGTRDSTLAMLTPGEVVLNRAAVRLLGGAERANRLNQRGMGAGADAGTLSGLIGQIGGQCLAWVSKFLPQFLGIPAAKDLAPRINTTTPAPGRVFVMTQPPYGHTGFVTGTGNPVPVIDSNWNLDERITAHAIPAGQIAGYIDVGQSIVGKIGDLIGGGIDLVGGLIGDALAAADKLGAFARPIARGIIEMARPGLGKLGEKVKSAAGNAWNAASTAISNAVGYATPAQLHEWMNQLGFHPAGGYAWADKIVSRESSWYLRARGPSYAGDAGSRGLWQIQPSAWPQFDLERLYEGLYNTACAQIVYQKQGPNAWSTNYDSGGIWPNGTAGVNRSGHDEVVLNQPTFMRLLDVLERIDRRGGPNDRPIELHQHFEQPGMDSLEDLKLALRMT